MDDDRNCKRCGTTESEKWVKCCPRHTSERGPDVMCEDCARHLHPQDVIDHNVFQTERDWPDEL